MDSVEMEPEESLDPEACFTEGEKGGQRWRGGERRGKWDRREGGREGKVVGYSERHRLPVPGRGAPLTLAAERRRGLMLSGTEEGRRGTREVAAL